MSSLEEILRARIDDRKALIQREYVGLLLGPAVFAFVHVRAPFEIPTEANAVLAGTLWIAIWWMTEAVPIPVTSLLPVVLFPLTGAVPIAETTASYADPVIFLLLGGFLIALAIERWGLHRRIALTIVSFVGVSPARLLFGFMLATAFLSMWISNTATAMMMIPIGTAVIAQFVAIRDDPETEEAIPNEGLTANTDPDNVLPTSGNSVVTDARTEVDDSRYEKETIDDESIPDPESLPRSRFGIALMLGIAYAASIGGAATIIGSPPNAVFAGVAASTLGVEIGFLQWMLFALPASAGFLIVTWFLLLSRFRPEPLAGREIEDVVGAQLEEMGDLGRGERRVLAVFSVVAGGWILRPFVLEPLFPPLTDSMIAIVGGILLFIVPVDARKREFLLEWGDTGALPWGVLLLLGAGFSIANAFQTSGLDEVIANALVVFADVRLFVLFLIVAGVVVFLTEVNSNTATATVLIPIMVGLAGILGVDPLGLMALTALAASYAFMLPVATPPNAIVFGSGYLTIPDMVRMGIWLNLIGITLAAAIAYVWLPFVF